MNDKYFVVCGNLAEFHDFRKKKLEELFIQGQTSITLSNFVWVDDPIKLKGFSNPHGWLVGTWRDNPNIKPILQTIYINQTNGATKIIRDLYNEILQSQS